MAVRRLADESVQPESFAFTAENLDWAKREITKYPPGRQHRQSYRCSGAHRS